MSGDRMTAAERTELIRLLEEARDECLAEVETVTDDQWHFRPSSGAWSIGLIGEHLDLVERGLFGRVEQALAHESNPAWETATGRKDAFIRTMLADRGIPRDAPAAVVPTGTVAREEALRRFVERRARSLAFAETTAAPLRAHTLDHHRPVYGTLNAYQWLLYIPLHNQRHIAQIRETKAASGYPETIPV